MADSCSMLGHIIRVEARSLKSIAFDLSGLMKSCPLKKLQPVLPWTLSSLMSMKIVASSPSVALPLTDVICQLPLRKSMLCFLALIISEPLASVNERKLSWPSCEYLTDSGWAPDKADDMAASYSMPSHILSVDSTLSRVSLPSDVTAYDPLITLQPSEA